MKRKHYKSTREMLHKAEMKTQKTINPVNPFILPLLLLFFVILDALTIYQLMDEMFYQSAVLSIVITLGIAIVLEGIPFLAAQFYMREKKSVSDKITMVILAVTFAMIFAILFALRWSARALTFSMEGTEIAFTVMNKVAESSSVVYETSLAEDMMTIVLGLSPLATSVLAFFLSCIYRTSDKVRDMKRLAQIGLFEQLKQVHIRRNEIENELKRDLERYNQELYEVALAEVEDYRKLLKIAVRQKLALHLGKASVITNLLEKEN